MEHPTFCIRVPASTSNCGPGFDTLGMALTLYNTTRLRRTEGTGIEYNGTGGGFSPEGLEMVADTAEVFFQRAPEAERFGFSFDISGEVPLARGLGSSVTLRAGILAGLNAAAGGPLGTEDLVALVSEMEGHPDNAAAGILGGFCVARSHPGDGDYLGTVRFEVGEELAVVVVSPEARILTRDSRALLPRELPFAEIVKSLNSLAFLVAVFAQKEYPKLRLAVTDFIHQPYRVPNIFGAREAIEKGVEAGAYTGWLSGSGSSILCVGSREDAPAIGAAMTGAFAAHSVQSSLFQLSADNEGMRLWQE